MIRRLIRISIQLRFLVVVIAVVMVVFGIFQLRSMPVDVYPEFNPPLVEIQTESLGLSAPEIESLITVPMEADLLNGVAWLDQLYSESVAGLSSILLVFEPGTDPIRARQMVQERLNQTYALPNVSAPPTMLQPLSTTGRVMMIGLSTDELSMIEMGVLARWNIVPRLMGVPGVSNVAIWGQRERQLQVKVDPVRLHSEGVTLQQIIETTGEALWVSPLSFLEASSPGTAGWIDTPNQRLSIRHLLPISSPEDLAKITIEGTDGLLLGDVTEVVEDHQPLIGDALLNNGPGLLLVVEKFPGANTLEVTRGVEEALVALQPGLTGIKFDTSIFRPAGYIEQAIGNLSILIIIAAILLCVVFALFSHGWRTALISFVTIPVAMIAATYVLYLRGASFNIMVLTGLVLALSIVIDDAVIGVESISRRLRLRRMEASGSEKDSEESIATAMVDAMLEVYNPIGFAFLIIILTVLPILIMSGLASAFFQPFVISYTMAVLASILTALIFTPALSMLLLDKGSLEKRESRIALWTQQTYSRFLARIVSKPRLAYSVIAVAILGGLIVLPFLKPTILPTLKQSDFLITWDGAPGLVRSEMNRIVAQVSNELRSVPGVRNVGSHVGRAITGDAVVGMNSGELWVSLDPEANYDATFAAVQEVVDGYPGLFRQVHTYQPKRIGEALAGSNQEIVVRVYGPEMQVLRSKAQEVSQALAGINGVSSSIANLPAEEPQVEIEVDLTAAERYHIKPGDVRRSVAILLSGLRVGNLYEGQKVFDVVVWGVPELRRSMTDIRDLMIDTPDGQVRLGDVADVRIAPTPVIIKRDSVSRFIDVTATVSGRNFYAVLADVQSRLQGIEFPIEHHSEILGNSVEQRADQQRILVFGIAALVGIFLVLQASFRSWHLAVSAFVTLPVALSGGALAAFLAGGVSLGSLFGFLVIIGITVRNGLLLTHHWRRLELEEGDNFGPELVLRGVRERLKPILMSVFGSIAVLLPIVVAGNLPGLEIVRPMAIVILGGLVTTTLLNLVITPILYLQYGTRREPELNIELAPSPAAD